MRVVAGFRLAADSMKGKYTAIPESNHTHWPCFRGSNVNVVAHVLIAELFDLGFLLLIVAEPVRLSVLRRPFSVI
jgi:hypothetical protein